MKTYGGVDVKTHVFLTSALVPPAKEPPGIHWLGGWVGPRTHLDAVEKRIYLTLPTTQPVVSRYTN